MAEPNNLPICPKTARVCIAEVTTALTSRAKITGTTGLTLLCTPGAQGTRIDQIIVQAAANAAQCIIFVWMYDGTTAWVIDEIPIAAVNGSTTLPGANGSKPYSNMVLPGSGRSLYVSVTVTQNMTVFGMGGDY